MKFKKIIGGDKQTIKEKFPWLLKADIENAVVDVSGDILVWEGGIWENGEIWSNIHQSFFQAERWDKKNKKFILAIYKMKSEKLEELADIEHQRWSAWQRYLHTQCFADEDGNLIIPKEKVKHWERQINTDYKDLSEAEKESDIEEVKRYLPLIIDILNKINIVNKKI